MAVRYGVMLLGAIQEAEGRRRARAAMAVGGILLVASVVFLIWAASLQRWALVGVLLVTTGTTVASMVLVRRTVRVAGYAFGCLAIAAVVGGAIAHGNPGFASFFLAVGVLLSAMVLPPRDVAAVFTLALVAGAFIAWWPHSTPTLHTVASVYAEGTLLLLIVGAVAIGTSVSVHAMVRDLETVLHVARDADLRATSLAAQLEHSQRMETVGRLAGVVAHDFNNLLTIIKSASALATEQLPEGSAIRADLHDLDAAVIRASALARQLLDFSRKDSSDVSVIDLIDVVNGLQDLLRRLVGAGVTVHLRTGAEPCPVVAAVSPLEQVLLNLAINARDAMGEQGDLYIDVHRTTERDGEVVRLIVRDTGCGMSEAVRVRAFEPFFTTKPAGQGTGLGLSTIESIVVRFGGRMSLVTAPGKGATFMITLPIATNIASPMSTTPSDPHVGTTATSFLN